MSEVAATAAPATPAPQSGTTPPPPNGSKPTAAKPTETPAEAKIRLGDKEYTEGQLKALVSRGEEGAKLMSAAAKKAQEAEQRIAEAEAREAVWKSGDPAKVRAELRKLGYDTRAMSEQEVKDAIKDEMLTPEQKRTKDLEEKLSAKERAEQEAQEKQAEEARTVAVKKATDTLAKSFVGAMEAKGIPLTHARNLLPQFAQLVRSYEAMGTAADDIPLDVIAEHLSEVDKGAFKRHLGDKPVEEILTELGPEKERELINLAVKRYKEGKAQKAGGVLPGAPPPKPQSAGALPSWLAAAPFDVKQAYFSGDETHPTVKEYLAKQKR